MEFFILISLLFSIINLVLVISILRIVDNHHDLLLDIEKELRKLEHWR